MQPNMHPRKQTNPKELQMEQYIYYLGESSVNSNAQLESSPVCDRCMTIR
jgi:hypothetical protein